MGYSRFAFELLWGAPWLFESKSPNNPYGEPVCRLRKRPVVGDFLMKILAQCRRLRICIFDENKTCQIRTREKIANIKFEE